MTGIGVATFYLIEPKLSIIEKPGCSKNRVHKMLSIVILGIISTRSSLLKKLKLLAYFTQKHKEPVPISSKNDFSLV